MYIANMNVWLSGNRTENKPRDFSGEADPSFKYTLSLVGEKREWIVVHDSSSRSV